MTAHVRVGSSRPKAGNRVSSVPPAIEQVLVEGTLSVEKFKENFDVLADAAGGIKQLKALLLELAIRGKLSGPHKGDESVEYQLSRIVQEKATVGSPGRNQNVSTDGEPSDTTPFQLPEHWSWVRWGDLVLSTESGWSPQCESRPRDEGEWGVLKVSAVSWDVFQPMENKALPKGVKPRQGCAVAAGDFLMSRANTSELVGRSVIVESTPKMVLLSDKLIRCVFSENTDKRYVNLYNRTAAARSHYLTNASGTSDSMKNISRGVILSMPIALPPLAEQKRIVARVDQLMALIDDLEQKQTRKRQLGANFTKASLEALTTAETPEDFDGAWKRVVENWGVVLDHPEKVWGIRKAILGLAGTGRLVPQRADDEPADRLVHKAQARLAKVAVPRQQERQDIPEQHIPTLPRGWVAVPWKKIAFCQNGRSFPSGDYASSGIKLLRPGNLHASGEVQWTADNTRYLPEKYAKEYPEFIVGPSELIMNLTAQSLKDEFLGRVCLTGAEERCLLNQRQARLTPLGPDIQYLFWYFRTPFFRSYVDGLNKGTLIQHMFTSQVNEALVLLPPLAEQKRIVAKVDHLMKLCDELEAKLRRSEDRASNLVEAVVQEMVG